MRRCRLSMIAEDGQDHTLEADSLSEAAHTGPFVSSGARPVVESRSN